MIKPEVRLAQASLGPVEKLREPLQDQLTSALQVAVDDVEENYAGEPVNEVSDELLEKTKAALHHDIADGFAPDRRQLHAVAEAIVDEAS